MVSEELQRAIQIEALGYACPTCNSKTGAVCQPEGGPLHASRVELAVASTVSYFESDDSEERERLAEEALAPLVPVGVMPTVVVVVKPAESREAKCDCNHKYANHCHLSKWGPPAVARYAGPCLCLCHRVSGRAG